MAAVHKNDVGTVFRLTIYENGAAMDISAATVKQIKFQKPSGTVVAQSGTFTTDGTNGQLEYTSVTSDLNEKGAWKLQVYLEIGGGKWHTDFASFTVEDILST